MDRIATAAGNDAFDPCAKSTNPFECPPDRALQVWRARPDLRAAFEITTSEGKASLVWWYFLHGFREIGFELTKDDRAEFLNQPQPGLRQLGFTPITRLMFEMHRRRGGSDRDEPKGLPSRFLRRLRRGLGHRFGSLDSKAKQERLLAWYFTEGLAGLNLLELLNKCQASALLAPDSRHSCWPRILAMIWQSDANLRNVVADPGDPRAIAWCNERGHRDWPILAHRLIALAQRSRTPARARQALPFGVNLFGHARARLGVGEDVRMAARALDEARVPYVICDVSAGSIEAEEHGLDHRIVATMPYAMNLFCMTGMETVAAMLARGRAHFDDHTNIGFWPWELPQWPALWHHAYGFVDEVWASTRFATEAFRSSASVQVSQRPLAVAVDATDGLGRNDFGLPAGHFLFGFAFDGLSSFGRKNPEGCISAFQQAFPDRDLPVGLVLKGLRVTDNPKWQSLVDASKADPRIHLLSGSYSRGALLDLFRALDCFISLHRSEGFGRNIAEAMLLGKPVIATAFSGNVDFTTNTTSFQVPYRLRPLKADEYPFGEGLSWAEPDIAIAAERMREVWGDAATRVAIAAAGQMLVASKYAPETVGSEYGIALKKLYLRTFSGHAGSQLQELT